MKRAVSFLITVYASVPVALYLFPWILGHAIFVHLLSLPFFVEVLNHTCNYLGTEEGASVGVWHTLPASQWEEARGKSPEWYRGTLGDGHPVVIYLHGNSGTRVLDYRVELVKILSAAGHHVLSLDYRGFGDSSGEPSEAGLTSDALYLFKWAMTQSKMYVFLPGFKSFLLNTLDGNHIVFPNEKNLKFLTCPLLLLHAEDGDVVPHHMGLKLYQTLLQALKQHGTEDKVEMISYSADLGFSHSNICLDPNLPKVVRGFLQKLRQ